MKRHIFIWTLLLTLIIGAGVASAVELLDPRIINLAEEFGMEVGRYGGTMTVHGGASGPKTFNPIVCRNVQYRCDRPHLRRSRHFAP